MYNLKLAVLTAAILLFGYVSLFLTAAIAAAGVSAALRRIGLAG